MLGGPPGPTSSRSATCPSAGTSSRGPGSAGSTSSASASTERAGDCRCGEREASRSSGCWSSSGHSAYARRPIGSLSGGEQQRLLIAQALVSGPRLLILDEPLDSLDLPNQSAVAALLERISREQQVAVLLVAHDVNPLLAYLDRVVYFGAGRAVVGEPREVIEAGVLAACTGSRSRSSRPPTGGSWWWGHPRHPPITATAMPTAMPTETAGAHLLASAPPLLGALPAAGSHLVAGTHLAASAPSLNLVADLHELLAYPFMVHALTAGTIVAVMSGLIGWFMVLRQQAFAGHTLSVMAFPGAAAALLWDCPRRPASSSSPPWRRSRSARPAPARERGDRGQESAVTGTVQAVGLACGFLFLSLYQGVLGNYESLLFGSFLGITSGQVLALAGVAAVAILLLGSPGARCCSPRWTRASPEPAGVPTRALGIGFLLLLGMAVAETAQITGALLVFALLVAPPATAQLLTTRTGLGLLLSVALGVLVTWVGLALAYFYEYPVGFYITTVAFVMYVARDAGCCGRPLDGPGARGAA